MSIVLGFEIGKEQLSEESLSLNGGNDKAVTQIPALMKWFDSETYLFVNNDVRDACFFNPPASAVEHYLRDGLAEGRSCFVSEVISGRYIDVDMVCSLLELSLMFPINSKLSFEEKMDLLSKIDRNSPLPLWRK